MTQNLRQGRCGYGVVQVTPDGTRFLVDEAETRRDARRLAKLRQEPYVGRDYDPGNRYVVVRLSGAERASW